MSSLAFDKQAKPFTFHKRTKLLRVRLFRNPRARGTCSQVLDDDGEPLYIDVETDYPEFRQIIGNVPGLYRLDQCDDDGNEIGDEPPAYVTVDPPRNAQQYDANSGDVNPLTIIREMAAIQGEALKALSAHQAQILASTAEIMRAPYRPAPPPPPAELRNALDNEDDDDEDDEDQELEDIEQEDEPAPSGGMGFLAQLAKMIDPKEAREFAHWAMSKFFEFRKETAQPAPVTVVAPVPTPAPAPTVLVTVAAPVPTPVPTPTAPVAATPAVPSSSTIATPSPVMPAQTVVTTQMVEPSTAPTADASDSSNDPSSGFPKLTEEQTLHIFAINARLSDQERAVAEHVIMRMGPEKLKRWAAELCAMSLEDATDTVRKLIAEIEQKRRNKAQR